MVFDGDAAPRQPAQFDRTPLLLALVALALCLPMVVFDAQPVRDCSGAYMPMIRELAAGNWDRGLHPRFPPFFTCFAALFAVLGVEPFIAAKLASSLLFAAGALPIFAFYRRFADQRTALWAAALYMLCPYLLRYGGAGLRDPGKTLFLCVAVFSALTWLYERQWPWALWTGAGCAGLTLVRGDGLGYATLILAVFLGVETVYNTRHHRFQWRWPTGALAAAALCGVLCLPWVAYEYRMTGYPVTDSRQVAVLLRIGTRLGIRVHGYRPTNDQSDTAAEPAVASGAVATPDPADADTGGGTLPINLRDLWRHSIRSILDGLYPFYLLFAVPVVVLRLRQRQWRQWESVLLAAVLAHSVLLIPLVICTQSLFVSKRYSVVVLPFLVGWTAQGMQFAYDWLARRRQTLARTAAAAVVLVLYWDGSKKARPSFNRGDREEWQAVKACIAWLNTDGKALLPATFVPPPLDLKYYRTGRQPVVFGREPALAYYANGDSVSRFLYLDMRDRMSVVEFCRQQGIQFVAWSPKLATDVPELARLDALPPEFVVLYDEWRGIRNSVVILGFLPNLRGAVPGHASRNLPAPGDESAKVLAPPGSTRPPAASNSRNALQPPLEFAASQTTFDLCG